jgi:hypothetical protein
MQQTRERGLPEIRRDLQQPTPKKWPRYALKALPWFIIWMAINGVGMKVNKLLSQYSDAPVLVQVGSDGKPILATQAMERHLNTANVQAFAAEVVPLLWRMDSKLPEEMGSGVDPGITVNGTKIPTAMYLAKGALDPLIADGFLEARVKTGPKDLWRGAAQTIQGLQVSEPLPTDSKTNRKIIVSGLLVTDNPDGSPRDAQRWARKLTVTALQKPRFLLKKSAIEEKYNLFLSRGLQITKIEDAREVLP